jgi:pilus assembly protein CpaB
MKPKTLILMIVAVGCGLAASFMTSRYLAGQNVQQVDEELNVLIPVKNLGSYARLTDPKLFETKVMKKSEVTKDVVNDFETIKNRIVKTPVEAGKPLAYSDLVELGQATLEYKLELGETAMAVKVSPDTASAGFILPGSKVDVLAHVGRGSGDEAVSRYILQNKEVLAINHEMETVPGTVNKPVERVVLRLKHAEAEEVGVYADTGMLRLTVRRGDDNKFYETEGGRVSAKKRTGYTENPAVLGEVPPATPSVVAPAVPDKVEPTKVAEKPDLGPHKMRIIEGTNVREFTFEQDKKDKKDKKDEKKDEKQEPKK